MKNNFIKVIKVETCNNILNVKFTISPELLSYFTEKEFVCKYDVNINNVPESILLIPFVVNVLPFVWIKNINLYLPSLDGNFFNCLKDIKLGYQEMYKDINFNGQVLVEHIVENNLKVSSRNLLLFSGGIDALSSFISHKDELLDLFLIGGADISLGDNNSWNNSYNSILNFANEYNKTVYSVKSNFKDMFNYKALNKLVLHYKDNWWHGFQHGIGMLGLTAPLCYIHKYNFIYIASSYTKGEVHTCASDPTIDNNLIIGCTQAYHDGFEFSRQDKIRRIIEYCKMNNTNINLRVCYAIDAQGSNCCRCEKCYRTIAALCVLGANPQNFGFNKNNDYIKNLISDLKYHVFLSKSDILYWKSIQSHALLNKNIISKSYPDLYTFFYKANFDRINGFSKYFLHYIKYLIHPQKIAKKILKR